MESQLIQGSLSPDIADLIDEIQVFDEIDSTNLEALRQIKAGKTGTRLLVADAQSAGRGRRDRAWISPAGGGLYMSLTRSFQSDNGAIQCLSLVTALSVLNAVESLGASGLELKWPNDILVGNRKLAGILLELLAGDEESHLVFGIGLNLSLTKEDQARIDRPVTDLESILEATTNCPNASIVVAEIVNQLIQNILLFEQQGFAPFAEAWNAYDRYLNRDIVIQAGNTRTIGRSLGVDGDGALILQSAAGRERITGGEIFPSLSELGESSD
ncbi:MAG TPA: biotin--[acetyl-CoA-carboxylase] ligase [Gammaproteobacteria bacterium]|jgi:BirA family biotin operon repressor/biotin-[acetyl-CoA-carboxylase] ligase|nr:biotin--[acetyl-CoA-carboxylase] ligase [Gammaproteobacteria bacterium]MDP6733601.1 biotin--[acetyl-CoA-carboxylase] ligase [Gammaproteobacteria bacterium]HAJ75328.1 biotin--[acetyl-CoA-carboxylase] ligase [Gammaproteobacteria bacterium]|tara:strand:+ start:2575 stop:3387 length:813 start_codon:yes stop_codon:yes gene_type:complete